ncbi:MAG: alpha/beta hydrolase [Ignavibacteriales bacterium]|nr:alpha/beta hydrolase [Ignavibacteriales bacterium]
MVKQDYSFITSEKEVLSLTAYGITDNINRCLIFVHGFQGFKDWGFGPYLGEYFASKGFFVLTFNFSHNGIGENPLVFSDLKKFAQNTYSREVRELSELINAYLSNYFGIVNQPKIGILGHSRGGAISLIASRNIKDVKGVALWASISYLDRYSERQKEEWKKKGFFEVMNQRTGQMMRIELPLLKDIEENGKNSLSIRKAVEELNRPLFIAHGEQDLAVPLKEAEEIYNWSDKKYTEFYKIPSAGHTFDIKHPFE